MSCDQPEGYVHPAGDCDDADPYISPGEEEICDGIDNDCDDTADEGCDGVCSLTVPKGYATIQGAIDAAITGDLICVGPGSYAETVDFLGKDVRVLGLDGPGLTTIDGGSVGAVVRFALGEGPAAILLGFTVTGGDVDGGVVVDGSAPSLVDLVVQNNSATFGGGLYVDGGAPALDRVRFVTNLAQEGGGMLVTGGALVTLDDVRFASNSATDSGGGLVVDDSSLVELDSCAFVDNYAVMGGGLSVRAGSALTAHNLVLLANQAGDSGGGLLLAGAVVDLENAVLAGNQAAGFGGAVHITADAAAALLVENAVLVANAARKGGALSADARPATLDLASNRWWNNSPDDVTGVDDPLGLDDNLAVDPAFLDAADPDPAAWDLHLALGSPLLDAGAVGVLDPDEGPSDIGAFGGPGADSWDLDGDGFPLWWQPGPYDSGAYPGEGWDCDDSDASVHANGGC